MGEIGNQVMISFVITVINSLEAFIEWSQEMFWVLSVYSLCHPHEEGAVITRLYNKEAQSA